MVISAQDTATSQPSDPLTVDPTPPPGDFIAPVSKPRSDRHTANSDAVGATEPRPWNLRSRKCPVATEPKERPRFSVALTCDEIAEDIYAVTGSLPRRRPKKRPRLVQKQIEMVLPGSWLKEITLELYKVPD